MSTNENTIYLENQVERYLETSPEDIELRAEIIGDLRENGFAEAAEHLWVEDNYSVDSDYTSDGRPL